MTVPEIRTQRIVLGGARMSHFAFHASDLVRFLGGPHRRDVAWRLFAGDASRWDRVVSGWWIVEADGRAVARIGPQRTPAHPETEIGRNTAAGASGRGYAVAAAHAAPRRFWRELRLPGHVGDIAVGNATTARLAKRIGARRAAADRPHLGGLVRRSGPA